MKAKKFGKFNPSSLMVSLPCIVAIFCLTLCTMNSFLGYISFKNVFIKQYSMLTTQVATTAASYINSDSILRYAQNPVEDKEWYETDYKLNRLTETAELAYIYVAVIDEQFENRTYIYDAVHPITFAQGSSVIPLGKVSSLKNKDEAYIKSLKKILLYGEPDTRFVYNNKTGGHVTTSVPLVDSSGRNVAIMSIVKPMDEANQFKQSYLKSTAISSLIVTLIFILLYIFLLYIIVIRPTLLLTKETEQFALHHAHMSGNLKKIKGKSELAILARGVEKMSVDMNDYIDRLTQATAEKERLGAELNVATQIQANMLPRLFPPYANHPEIELFATMTPAKEVGGDFYDFFMIDDDHFAALVGDVSGKGVPAALFMVIAKTLLKNGGLHSLSPADVFEQVNNELCEGNDAGLFVTCWMGILTLSTGEMTFANAGHAAPIINRNGEVDYLVTKPNLMLGAMEDMKYQDHTVTIKPGTRLFIYTDGVTEATNAENQLYGEERLLQAARKLQSYNSKEILEEFKKDIEAFVGNAPQFDDITMLELSLKAGEGSESKMKKLFTKTFQATDENMTPVNDFIHALIPEDCNPLIVNQIDLAVEEIYINIAHYAYAPKTGQVEITCELEEKEGSKKIISVTFKDSGKKFNPLKKQDPDISLSAEERDIGGLGIFLTKKFMDDVEYLYNDNSNILKFSKTICE